MKKIEKIKFQDVELEIQTYNTQKENTLLLLHGFNDTKETFVFLEEFLTQHFNLISYDHRGHGGSSWNQSGFYHYGEILLDLHRIVENFLSTAFSILGHSLGAGLAARYSGLYPEKIQSLILLEGFSGLQAWKKEKQRILNWLEQNSTPKIETKNYRKKMTKQEALQKLTKIYPKHSKEKLEVILKGLTFQIDENHFAWKNDPHLKQMIPLPFPPELSRFLWKEISCPVLLFFGEQTHIRPSNLEEIQSHFKNLHYFEVPNSGHNLQHENPEFLIQVLKTHLGLTK